MARNKNSSYGLMEGLSFTKPVPAPDLQKSAEDSSLPEVLSESEVLYKKTDEAESVQEAASEVVEENAGNPPADSPVPVSGRPSNTHSHQGRKGEKAKRSCIAFSDENYEFIKRESKWNGQTYSAFLEGIIDDYRKSYKRPEY